MGKMLPQKRKIGVLLGLLFLCISSEFATAADFSCQKCVDDCQDYSEHVCAGVGEVEKCYMRFDEVTGSVVDLGCSSELQETEDIAELIKQKVLYECEENNCNGFENVPAPNNCMQCSSDDSEICATNPATMNTLASCQVLPYTQCYQRVNAAGITERGCVNDLPTDDFYSCVTSADEKCKICTGTACNEEVIPADRRQCHRCSSEDDSTCQSSPNALSVCPVYNADESCVSFYENGLTTRGCRSEISCDATDENCQVCSTDGCNIHSLPRESDSYGIFQELPLNCYACSGSECLTSVGIVNMCSGNVNQDCMTVFDATGQVVRRGCEAVVESEYLEYCVSNPELCFNCKSNGCNLVQSTADYIDCLYCDGQSSDDCLHDIDAVTRTRKCYKSCMTALYPRTDDAEPAYELMRTCLDDMDMDDRDECEAGSNSKCISCSSDKCNTDALVSTQSCYQCKGDECIEPTAQLCRAFMDHDECYIQLGADGEITQMGCRSDYNPSDIKELLTTKTLWLCDENNCNAKDNLPTANTCTFCDSRTDANCSIAPALVTTSTSCSNSLYTECYTRIIDGGHTERGCLDSLVEDDFYNCYIGSDDKQCSICTGDNCNSQIHPIDRLSCYVCDSATSDACESTPNDSQACLLYSPDVQCVSILNDGVTIRGCSSSELTCDPTDSRHCEVCADENCNTKNLQRTLDGYPGVWQELPLTCYSCDGATDCLSTAASDMCTDNNYCMTVFDSTGAVVRRGCSDAVESEHKSYCDTNSANCYNCNSNLCNSASSQSDYIECIYCDSVSNPDCSVDPLSVGQRRNCHKACMTALYPRTENGSVYELSRSCLDDKEIADQSACQLGDELCLACESAACNTALLPSARLSCYNCESDECTDPKPAMCSSYQADDQCFMLFNDQNDITQLGCLSDLSEQFIADNVNMLHTCSEGDNCNGYENIPTPKYCAACDSRVDPECATDPAKIPMVQLCTSFGRLECYTRVSTSDGSTLRGCLSNLTNAQIVTCLEGSADCTTCLGDNCNLEVFPADRRRCHRCNSKEDRTCESTPQSETACPVYDADDGCAVKLVNGATYRGCSSDFECDDFDKQYCRMCSTDNCNFMDLASSNIGYPGRWQDVPVNCYTCLGDECSSGTGSVQMCAGSTLQNCATVFALDGSVVQRGCSDQVYANEYASYCEENPSYCKFCKSNGCNDGSALSDYVDCLFCDAEQSDCISNPAAISRTRSCHGKCVTALYPRTSESNPAYELERTCLDDMDMDDREACENSDSGKCIACDWDTCNTAALPENRLTCYTCVGDNCDEPQQQECTSYREHDQCFVLFESNNEPSRMGCGSDLDTSFMEANTRQLWWCDGDSCNHFENFPTPISCSSCNSLIDPNCASNPARISETVLCSNLAQSQCFTLINAYGGTERGCLSSLTDALLYECSSGLSLGCEVCTTDNCNTEVFPAGRMSCNRCDASEDPTCEDNPILFNEVCPIFWSVDTCVTAIEGDNVVRGCSSEMHCDSSDITTCRVCETDGCNTVNLLPGAVGLPGKWQDLPLNCYTCEGADCATGSSVQMCEGSNLQTCMTVFGSDNAVQRRGCSYAVSSIYSDYCDENPDKCFTCKSNGCNNATSVDDFTDCYFCDSTINGDCFANPDNLRRTRKCQGSCMAAMYPRTSSNNPSYEMSRSCLDDLDIDDREACSAGNKDFCAACEGDRCNTMQFPIEGHECYKCTTEDCMDFSSQNCSSYHPNDQCYILFNTELSIIGMGCSSEFEEDTVAELVKQKKMILCDAKNCNSMDIIQTPKECSVCESENDVRCATNPNLISNPTRCSGIPYTDCYTRVTEDGHTHRGCLASLDSETFYKCLMNTDGLCETCTGDNCNSIDVYPDSRLRCHQCDSAEDALCSTSPDSNRVCPLFSPSDACVTNIYNGITTRGCASSLRCDNEDDARTCRVCTTSGCNTVDLETVSEHGEPGKWQDVPLFCRACVSEEDCATDERDEICSNASPYQNCMTVFNAEGAVVQRGCSDAVLATQATYCNANAGKCVACNSNDCNVASSLDDYIECWACDTDTDGNCVQDVSAITKTRMCHKHCMTAFYVRHSEDDPAYGLARTCYDDMELADREACAAGNLANCQICSEAKCNVQAIPETRLSCYSYDGDESQEPQAKTCTNYREDDKCYIQFDETRNVISMGCRSEFTNADADQLFKKQRLFYCEGDNCNTIDALPVAQTCTLCASRTDINCSILPSEVYSNTSCSTMPYPQCYTRVLSSGVTERGCLSNLFEDEFVDCLTGSSTTCSSCIGSFCNREIYPADRLSCHICDASVDPDCATNPNSLSICPIYNAEESCVTAIQNGVIHRGCSSSLTCNSSTSCTYCTGNGCNDIEFTSTDDNFGKWQDLPLRCWTCSGDECDAAQTTESSTCENNNEQDCMTVFDENGKVIMRGCQDNVQAEYDSYCVRNADHCFNCKSNECNTAAELTDFVECIYCDSHTDPNCIWEPLSITHKTRKCQHGCMTALYMDFEGTNPGYATIRTCLNDKEADDQTACSTGRYDNCRSCTEEKCNVDTVPTNLLSCYICEGDDCEEPTSKLCPLYRADDQCFIWFDNYNSINQMGCMSSFRDQNFTTIIKTKRVFVCDGENCNSMDQLQPAQICATCESSEDVQCATKPTDISTFDTCSQYPYTNCYTKINTYGQTSRGCLSILDEDEFVACVLGTDENCSLCQGEGCNQEIYPADRQQCYVCTSEDDSNCESDPTETMPCPYIHDTESCRTTISQNVTLRGCSSQINCDQTDSGSCRSCFGTACNSIDLINKIDDGIHGTWQDLPLRCHTCEGEHCNSSLGPAVTCSNNANQDCMTVFNATGEVRRRGCSDAVDDYEDRYCRQNPGLCFKCKSNECNIAWALTDYIECAFCDSETNPLCAINPENGSFDNRSCYKECMVAMKDDHVVRSCLDDKELHTQYICRANETGKECSSCENNDCNKFVYPADRLNCHICADTSCTTSTAQYCELYDESDFCFVKFESSKPDLMGCGSSQNSSDLNAWEAANQLFRCTGNECNALANISNFTVCIACDSSKTPNCAQNVLAVTTVETCSVLNDSCAVRIDSAGNTIRGCLSSVVESGQNCDDCYTCSGDSCNNNLYPADRRTCHICNSVADETCISEPAHSQVCPLYQPDDMCITKNTDGYIERGCQSSITCDGADACDTCALNDCNVVDLSGAAALMAGSLMLTSILAFALTVLQRRF